MIYFDAKRMKVGGIEIFRSHYIHDSPVSSWEEIPVPTSTISGSFVLERSSTTTVLRPSAFNSLEIDWFCSSHVS